MASIGETGVVTAVVSPVVVAILRGDTGGVRVLDPCGPWGAARSGRPSVPGSPALPESGVGTKSARALGP